MGLVVALQHNSERGLRGCMIMQSTTWPWRAGVSCCRQVKRHVQSPGQQETDEKFGRLWFASLARFHKVRKSHTWDFDNDHVIEFLRSKLSEKMPTWKRLKIVQGLIWYRNNVRKSASPELEPIRSKLREMAATERERSAQVSQAEATIEGVVGKIDPSLPEAIQALKRIMRLKGNPYNSEKAYVGKVKAFMEDFGLQTVSVRANETANVRAGETANVGAELDLDSLPSTQPFTCRFTLPDAGDAGRGRECSACCARLEQEQGTLLA